MIHFFIDYFMTLNNLIFLTNYIMCLKKETKWALKKRTKCVFIFVRRFYFLQCCTTKILPATPKTIILAYLEGYTSVQVAVTSTTKP